MQRIAILIIWSILTACATEQSKPVPSAVAHPVPAASPPQPTVGVMLQSTASPFATQNCEGGDHFDEVEPDGQRRQYLLHTPAAYQPEQSAALVLVFHGAGIGPERFVSYSCFSDVADRDGFLIVDPQGLGERPAWDPSPDSPDVQFVRDLIDRLQKLFNVDPDRVYASGHSNGGGMANRLACELADRIAAIGTVSGAYGGATADCSPSRPVPVFAIHGTQDSIVAYKNIPNWALDWVRRNGCDPEPLEIPHNVLLREQTWSNCRAGADVVLYTIEDMGHDWTRDLVDMGQTTWEFFEKHPLR